LDHRSSHRLGLRRRRGRRCGFDLAAVLGALALVLKRAGSGLFLAAAVVLGQAQALFLRLTQQAGLHFLARLAAGRRRRRRGRRLNGGGHWRRWRRGGGGFGRRSGLARLADQLALLHLDHHLVGAAVAEGLLDLARFDRALQPQRLAAQRRFVVGLAHKFQTVLQNQFVVRSGATAEAVRSLVSLVSVRVRPPMNRSRRFSTAASLSAAAESVSARWTTLSRPNATDKAARSSGKRRP